MDINGVIDVAERVDPGARSFKAGSTRETRNQKWAYIIGCVYHGHPQFNPHPDPQWHIKDAGGGRPQSDDVTVSMPSRDFWDCIPGSGSDSAHFADHYGGTLSYDQNVYPPPVPAGGGTVPPEPGQPPTQPPTQPPPAGLSRAEVQAMIDASMANAVQYGQLVGLQASTGSQKVLCHENGGPSGDHEEYKLTSRSNVGPWESWRLHRGTG